jgi:hypothetical protein
MYAFGTVVTLEATAAPGSSFDHWTGCSPVIGTNRCTVTMDHIAVVEAFFEVPQPQNLRVVNRGTGTGTVTGDGIDCGNDCAETYPFGTVVTLTATADAGSVFSHWDGCPAEVGAVCIVTMDKVQVVEAHWLLDQVTLTVELSDSSEGSVGGVVSETTAKIIQCGDICSAAVDPGTLVTLTATPAEGFAIIGWIGCNFIPRFEGTCTFTVDSDITVTPIFEPVV